MRRICASVLALSLFASHAFAQTGALPAAGQSGVRKAQTVSTFWVVTAGVGLLGAGAFLISTMGSASNTGTAFSGGDGNTLLNNTGTSTATTTTTG